MFSLLVASASLAASALAYTPAYSNATASERNSTFLAGWRSEQGQGTLNQGVTLLSNGTDTQLNSTYYGIVVYFNETSAVNQTSTPVPWIAFVSCDSNPSTEATLSLPFTVNGTIAANSTLEGSNQTISTLNLTDSTFNATDLSGNSTSRTINGVNETYLPDVFSLAAGLGASSVLLYSEQAESCQLNYTANQIFNNSIPIFSSPSREVTNQILSSQFGNIASDHRYFNSTLLTSSASNLSSIIANPSNTSIPTQFLIGRLTASFDKNDSSNGVVATIGRAPTSTRTAQGTTQTGGDQAPSSGAEGRYTVGVGALMVAGLMTLFL
ncbi:uncharacterized protein JCM6883_006771 [Sporobolomyces salmoneus]|uniref:uncharacterized protein n=1 Tax=Sporobolomyces salmoneus TaxID=183962 RepID=UPI0031809615